MLILDENNIQTKSMKIYIAHYAAGLFGKIRNPEPCMAANYCMNNTSLTLIDSSSTIIETEFYQSISS